LNQKDLTKSERKAFKAQRRIEKEQNKISKESGSSNPTHDKDITILCVRFGNKYGSEYVKKLRNMVSRHLTVPYTFACLTDDPTPIDGVKIIHQKNKGYTRGWWHKVHMFDPNLPIEGRILYFDLDVIIHNNIDRLTKYDTNNFIGIRDFNRKFHSSWKHLNSSVMAWNHGTQKHIWDQFRSNTSTAIRMHGDQDWIWKTSKDRLKFWPDLWIQSYKWEIRSKQELFVTNGRRNFKEIKNDIVPHQDCSVAVFHGDPNPENVKDKFVVDNWK